MIIGIASNPSYFTFLKHCQPNPDIVLGDARLTMAKEANDSFDLMSSMPSHRTPCRYI